MTLGRNVHVAGVIPVANLETDHELETPACLTPVNTGFTAIQKSVFECALAGCQTIWIVANQDLAPIVRKIVGDWIYDPVYYNRTKVKFYKEVRREIPIYYVPINDRDRDRRDSYGWSVLHGVNSAWWVANKISKWLTPEKYFVSFPMAAYDIYSLREHRKEIADKKTNFFLIYNNKSMKDNLPLAFTMTGEDFILCRRNINKLTTKEYLPPPPGKEYPSQKLPFDQRWSARNFKFDMIFDKVDSNESHIMSLNWFYDLSCWEEYRYFMGSKYLIEKPYKGLTGPHKHAKLIIEKEKDFGPQTV